MYYINNSLAQNKNLTAEQINILLNKNDDSINYFLVTNPKLTTEQIDFFLNKKDDTINYYLTQNPNLTTEQINILLDDPNNYNLAKNKNIFLFQQGSYF